MHLTPRGNTIPFEISDTVVLVIHTEAKIRFVMAVPMITISLEKSENMAHFVFLGIHIYFTMRAYGNHNGHILGYLDAVA